MGYRPSPFAGARKDRLLDMEPGLPVHGRCCFRREYGDVKDPMVLSLWLSEQYHIEERHHRNQQRVVMDLRLAPPVVFAGRDVVISIPG